MTTMKDVAQLAGVSTSTVSRALSGAAGVRSDVRDQVLDAANRLAYRPNQHASNLRRGASRTIGVVVTAIENPYFVEAVRAIEALAFARGFRMLLCNTDSRPAKQRAYLQVLAEERVQGIILVPSEPDAPEIGHVIDLGIPLVAFDRPVTDPRADSVVVDNALGAELATSCLIDAGHRAIAFLAGRPGLLPSAERLTGYRQTMERAGLPPVVLDGWTEPAPGRAAAKTMLTTPDITACVTTNAAITIGVLDVLREHGKHAPEDLAIAMFEDPPWARLVTPGLTAVAIPTDRMADGALRLLLDRPAARFGPARTLVYSPLLQTRGSSGPGAHH